ncbi:MAG: hypothetical protein SGJ11_08335 [Phycisphaerae bacterium]|nr:hypothetical protein [Phycisphaerae bacterium]
MITAQFIAQPSAPDSGTGIARVAYADRSPSEWAEPAANTALLH